jgi:hypothetical protein
MLATCRNGNIGLAIANERRGERWWSLMREGNANGKSWSTIGVGAATVKVTREATPLLCSKKSLAFG